MGIPAEQEYVKAVCNLQNITNYNGVLYERGESIHKIYTNDEIKGLAFSPVLARYGFTVPPAPWSYSQRAYIACGTNGHIYSSLDGNTWHGRSITGDDGSSFNGCCWGNAGGVSFGMGQYVVVGNNYPFGALIYTSELGGTTGVSGNDDWLSQMPDGMMFGGLYRVKFCKDRYIAVGFDNTDYAIQVSLDGVTWVARSHGLPHTDYELYGISYGSISGNDRYVIVGLNEDTYEPVILYSNDSTTWYQATIPEVVDTPEPVTLYDVTYGNGLFVAVGEPDAYGVDSRPVILTSPDGINWTHRKAPPFYVDFRDDKDLYAIPGGSLSTIAYGSGVFLAAGGNLSGITYGAFCAVYSIDGVSWYAIDSGAALSVSHNRRYLDIIHGDIDTTNFFASCFGDNEFFLGCKLSSYGGEELDFQSSGPMIIRSKKLLDTRIGRTVSGGPT